jgi:hypothetical protein
MSENAMTNTVDINFSLFTAFSERTISKAVIFICASLLRARPELIRAI